MVWGDWAAQLGVRFLISKGYMYFLSREVLHLLETKDLTHKEGCEAQVLAKLPSAFACSG